MSPYDELRLLLGSCEDGETRKEICPHCGGGRTGELSLSITRFSSTSGAYQCKRASCAKEGWIGDRYGTHYAPVNKPKEREARIYDGTIEEISDDNVERYADKYGWTSEEVRRTGVGWSPEYQRSVWKILSPTGSVRGIELRTLNPQSRAKTLHFRHSADEWVGYVGLDRDGGAEARSGRSGSSTDGQGGQPLVAVEDLISAYRVGQVYPCAAVMGSHITFDILMDLMKVSHTIVLMLDRDATEKAEKFARRFSFLCPDFVHIPITRDLKYEDPEKIKDIIEAYR